MGCQMKTCLSTEQKFYFMIALVGSFFFVEIVSGYVCNSLALISDAFHMLSDLIALFVGLAALRISKMKSERNSFGWARAEVLGALVNAVFMLAVCLTIVLESIERFLKVQKVERPVLLLLIGFGGLMINVIAFLLFISGETKPTANKQPRSRTLRRRLGAPTSPTQLQQFIVAGEGGEEVVPLTPASPVDENKQKKAEAAASHERSMNIAAVLRHVIGDAMGSVIVVFVACLIWQVDAPWVLYLDPTLSLCLVGAMSSSTFPLLNEASQVLIQQCPPEYAKADFRKRLTDALSEAGVISYHSLQIWRLSGSRIVASIHIVVPNVENFMDIVEDVRRFFHSEKVHSITVQPEPAGQALNCHQHEHEQHEDHYHDHQGNDGPLCCCNAMVTRGVLASNPTAAGTAATIPPAAAGHPELITATEPDIKSMHPYHHALFQKLMHAESTSCLFAAASTDEGQIVHHCHPIVSCTPVIHKKLDSGKKV